jgi:broad specificity phosphatase PhoE
MITLYLGRHGETALNKEHKLRGWKDVPLTEAGKKDAENLAVKMKDFPIERFYASDLERAADTARIIAKPHGEKPILRNWFRPLNYGDLNGKPLKEVEKKLFALNDAWSKDPSVKAPNGESFDEFQDRNLGGIKAIMAVAEDGDKIMLVAHLRNALLFHAVALNGGLLEGKAIQAMDGKNWNQDHHEVSKFEWDGEKLKFIDLMFGTGAKKKGDVVS